MKYLRFAIVIVLHFVILGCFQSENRQERINLAVRLADDSIAASEFHQDPELGLLLAVEAAKVSIDAGTTLPQVDRALRNSLDSAPRFILHHDNPVEHVVFSPDGAYIATRTWGNGVVHLFEMDSRKELAVIKSTVPAQQMVFSPDSTSFVVDFVGNIVRIYDAATGIELMSIRGEIKDRNTIVFSPDGSHLALSENGNIRIINVQTQEEFENIAKDSETNRLREFSTDSNYAVITTADNSVRLFNISTRKSIADIHHAARIQQVSFSPDNALLITVSIDGVIKLIDVTDGNEVLVLSHPVPVRNVIFHPDGTKMLVVTDVDGITSFDIVTGKKLHHFQEPDRVIARVLSPNGSRLAIVDANKILHLFDVATGNEIAIIPHADHERSWVRPIVFSPDSSRLATATGTIVRLFDAVTGVELPVPHIKRRYPAPAMKIAFSPDSSRLITHLVTLSYPPNYSGLYNTAIQVLDAVNGEELFVYNHGHYVQDTAFSPDNIHLATASLDGTVRIYDMISGVEPLLIQRKADISYVDFTPDGNHLVTLEPAENSNSTMRVLDVTNGNDQNVIPNVEGRSEVIFGANSNLVATAGSEYFSRSRVRVVDTTTGKEIGAFYQDGQVWKIVYSPTGKNFLTFTGNGIHLFDSASYKQLATIEQLSNSTYFVLFSPDELFVAISDGNRIQLLNTSNGDQIAVLDYERQLGLDPDYSASVIAFTPDAKHLAVVNNEFFDTSVIRLISTTSGKEASTLRQEGYTSAIAIAPEGIHLITGNLDGLLRIVDLNNITDYKEVTTFNLSEPIQEIMFSPNGSRLVTRSQDSAVRIFDSDGYKEIASFDLATPLKKFIFAPVGNNFVALNDNVQLYSAVTGQKLRQFADIGEIMDVVFSLDGTQIATAGRDGAVRIFDVTSGETSTILHLDPVVWKVAFSPDGNRIAMTAGGSQSYIFDIATSSELANIDYSDDNQARTAFSPDLQHIMIASDTTTYENITAQIFDTVNGKELAKLRYEEVNWRNWAIAEIEQTGQIALAVVKEDKALHLIDVATNKELAVIQPKELISRFMFSPKGSYIATISENRAVNLVKTTANDSSIEIPAIFHHEMSPSNLIFSPDETRLITINGNGKSYLFNTIDGKQMAVYEHNGNFEPIEFSPDSKRFVVYEGEPNSYSVRLFDAETGEDIALLAHSGKWIATFSPDSSYVSLHEGQSNDIYFFDAINGSRFADFRCASNVSTYTLSPDKSLFAVGCDKRRIHLFNTTSGQELATLFHNNTARAISFSPDGRRLLTGSHHDGTARLWSVQLEDLVILACSIVGRNLTEDEWQTYLGTSESYRTTCSSY